MSEVPSNVQIPRPNPVSIRDSASLMLTRTTNGNIEILLGKRAETMRVFPNFWSFPGGGLSRKDMLALKELDLEEDSLAVMKICVFRELCEELGLTVSKNKLLSIDKKIRSSVIGKKENWLKYVQSGEITFDPSRLTMIRERITPIFAPVRFHNRFFHLHVSKNSSDYSLEKQTEFDEAKWYPIDQLLSDWNEHCINLPPPIFTLIRDLNDELKNGTELEKAVKNLRTESPEEKEINFSAGVVCIPVETETLPPLTTTNCYILGRKGGDLLIVDPAAKNPKDIQWIMDIIELLEGNVIGLLITHRHSDHYGDLDKFMELTNSKIWCSKHTSEYLELKDALILNDGEKISLKHPEFPIDWEVMITPGHCPGHICLFSDAGLIAGDMVAGYGTILIPNEGNMEIYIEQLKRIKNLDSRILFPAHGPLISIPEKKLSHYINHREIRQIKILETIKKGVGNISKISEIAYEDTKNVNIVLSELQTLAHLLSLERLGKISKQNNSWVYLRS